MPLILVFDATNCSRRSPGFHSASILDIFFFPRSGLTELSHWSRSRIILNIVSLVREQDAGPHLPCELLQVCVKGVLIEESLVVVVERLEQIDILFVFDEGY
jgi:hypothetical protein